MTVVRIIVVLIVLGWTSAAALAQQAQLLTAREPYHVGVPVDLQVVASGFEEQPEPTIEAPPVANGRLSYAGVSPNVKSSIQIINGRTTQSRTVRFIYRYQFVADRPGDFTVGPFKVVQNGKQANTGTVTLRLGEIAVTSDQTVTLKLPQGPVYIGQQVPLEVQWRYSAQLHRALFNPRLRLPLLAAQSEFQLTPVSEQTEHSLVIDSPSGAKEYPAQAKVVTDNGQEQVLYSVRFIMTPLKAGEFALDPVSLTVDRATEWRRDLFGNRTPTRARKSRVVDDARTLVVTGLPTENRPASFSGAIGSGFSLHVSADRSVVKVGDPITLTLTLRGDAAMEKVSLPALTAMGLPAQSFRLPSGQIAGSYSNDGKQFKASVRILGEDVGEIPPLEFAWFDPERRAYQTSLSQPIALSVRAGQVVSAGDVVRTPGAGEEETSASATEQAGSADSSEISNDPQTAEPSDRRPAFSLSGADLAIVQQTSELLTSGSFVVGRLPLQIGCYAIGLTVLGLAVVGRRRRAIDPAIAERHKHLRRQRDALSQATAFAEVASALRQLAATADVLPRVEYESLLAECDNRAYAPGGATAPLDNELRQRAVELADSILAGRA